MHRRTGFPSTSGHDDAATRDSKGFLRLRPARGSGHGPDHAAEAAPRSEVQPFGVYLVGVAEATVIELLALQLASYREQAVRGQLLGGAGPGVLGQPVSPWRGGP